MVYVSVDQDYAEPVLKAFERQSGLRVLPVYDVEASKTTGLVNRLIAEKQRPQADVFWNGEFVQTLELKRRGVLAPYRSPRVEGLPEGYFDAADQQWASMGGRVRVLLMNEKIAPAGMKASMATLLDSTIPPDRAGFALPLFGTTATHAAAIYALNGEEAGREYFAKLQARGIRVASGNSTVRDLVVGGQLAVGLTDSDDACGAIRRGAAVRIVLPDQDGQGTLVVTGTVAMVAGGPNPAEGRELVDFLLSAEAERLAFGPSTVPRSLHYGVKRVAQIVFGASCLVGF